MSKKPIALVLAFLMLLACFSVGINANPDSSVAYDGSSDGIKVDSVSYSSPDTTKNWSVIWDRANKTTLAENLAENTSFEAIGKFETPTTVKKLILTTQDTWSGRGNGIKIQLSTDGTTWVDICTVSGLVHNSGVNYFEYTVTDDTTYGYIRVLINGPCYFAITRVIVQNAEIVANNNALKTKPYKTNTDFKAGLIWNPYNEIGWVGLRNNNATEAQYSAAELDGFYKITKIEYTTSIYSGRSRGSTIEASDDGENWTVIANQETDGTKFANLTTYTFNITDTKPYKYVRIVQAPGLMKYNTDCLHVRVYGDKPVEPVTLCGVHVKDNGDSYSVRLMAAGNNMDFTKISYKVTASYKDATEAVVVKSIEKDTNQVYSAVLKNGETITAASLGASYITAMSMNNIPDSIGEVTLTVQISTYLADGSISYTIPQSVTFNAGAVVD